MKIAITGERGFLGVHLTNYFKYILRYEVVELGRDYLLNIESVREVDWLIVGAFIQRHSEKGKVLSLNSELTNKTIEALNKIDFKGSISFLSSIQEGNNTEYGKAKLESSKLYEKFCIEKNRNFISLKLPNIFGKYALPYKTSFIATFCYALHNQRAIEYNKNEVLLCHVTDAISIIAKFEQKEIQFVKTTVEEVYMKLREYNEVSRSNQIPVINTKFDLNLFMTFIEYTNYKL
jgi:UDP-2-acetamido-2,6-beta-L-arabino-hexul-4-ose reductase